MVVLDTKRIIRTQQLDEQNMCYFFVISFVLKFTLPSHKVFYIYSESALTAKSETFDS